MKTFRKLAALPTTIDMKLFEILNQAKATLEGISLDRAWDSLAPETEKLPRALRRFLATEFSDAEAQAIYRALVKQMKRAHPRRIEELRKAIR